MGLLRIFSFCFIDAVLRGQVTFAIFGLNGCAAIADGFADHADTVGSHIGDKARCFAANINAFIETLGRLHGLRGREAELAGGFLLERRCHKGR